MSGPPRPSYGNLHQLPGETGPKTDPPPFPTPPGPSSSQRYSGVQHSPEQKKVLQQPTYEGSEHGSDAPSPTQSGHHPASEYSRSSHTAYSYRSPYVQTAPGLTHQRAPSGHDATVTWTSHADGRAYEQRSEGEGERERERAHAQSTQSAWGEWTWNAQYRSYYRARRGRDGNLEYEWNQGASTT